MSSNRRDEIESRVRYKVNSFLSIFATFLILCVSASCNDLTLSIDEAVLGVRIIVAYAALNCDIFMMLAVVFSVSSESITCFQGILVAVAVDVVKPNRSV